MVITYNIYYEKYRMTCGNRAKLSTGRFCRNKSFTQFCGNLRLIPTKMTCQPRAFFCNAVC